MSIDCTHPECRDSYECKRVTVRPVPWESEDMHPPKLSDILGHMASDRPQQGQAMREMLSNGKGNPLSPKVATLGKDFIMASANAMAEQAVKSAKVYLDEAQALYTAVEAWSEEVKRQAADLGDKVAKSHQKLQDVSEAMTLIISEFPIINVHGHNDSG